MMGWGYDGGGGGGWVADDRWRWSIFWGLVVVAIVVDLPRHPRR